MRLVLQLQLQLIWQLLNLCMLLGSSGFGKPLSRESYILDSLIEAQAPHSKFESVYPSSKSPPLHDKGPPPLLLPRISALPPLERSLTTSPLTPTPYDSAPPIASGTPYYYTPPPVVESAHAPSALVLQVDATPPPVVEPPHTFDVPLTAKPPQVLASTPPEEALPFLPTPPSYGSPKHGPVIQLSPVPLPALSPPSQMGPSQVSSPSASVPSNASVLPPLMLEPRPPSPVLAANPPQVLTPEPPVEAPPFMLTPLPYESPQHAPTIQLSPTPWPVLPPPSQMGPSQASSQTTAPPPFMLPFPLEPRQPPSSPSPSVVNEPALNEPPPPAGNVLLLQSSPPFAKAPSHAPSRLPGAATPHASALPLAANPPLLPVSEPPKALALVPPPELHPVFPSPPPNLAMQSPPMPLNESSPPPQLPPSIALSPPQSVSPIASSPLPQLAPVIASSPSASSIQPPSMFQNASSPPALPSPPIVSSPPPEIIPPTTSSPPPQSAPLNASSPVPPRTFFPTPALPPSSSFSPPFMVSPPLESPPYLPNLPTPVPQNASSSSPQMEPLPASSPPPQLPPLDASSPVAPPMSHISLPTPALPPSSSFSPPLIGPPPIDIPPHVSTKPPPVPQNASSLPPQMGPPLASSPPRQLVVPPPASPPTSVLPSIPLTSPPPMIPSPVLPAVSPAMPPHNTTMLSPPMPSQAVSPLPHFVLPHSFSAPLANPPQMFSAPPGPPPVKLPTTSPISAIVPGAISPSASSPPLILSPPFASPPQEKRSHTLIAPPPSESTYPSSPPPAVNRTVPALPPHSSQRKVTKAGAPPPLHTSPEASPSSGASSRAAPPFKQDKPESPPPIWQPVEAPKQSVSSPRLNASAPSEPKFEWHNETAPAPSFFQVNPAANVSYHSRHRLPGAPMAMAPLPSPQGIHEISSAASPIPHAPPGDSEIPFLSPDISPSGSPPRKIKKPLPSPIRSLPPPPPNADCAYLTCPEPSINTPPGSPCGCVWPMQVGMRLSVALYTFFPLVSELSQEIASGVFLKPSQVRVMGANAATQDPEKTIVLVDLVPLDEKFDNITSHLISDRFWQKQVIIEKSIFGDYEILYVRYPGLPPAPPMAPADAAVINGMPYSVGDPNESKLHPLGVDVTKQRHKHKVNAIIIAVIALSAVLGVLMCCSLAWFLVFRYTNNNELPTLTPRAVTSLGRSSGHSIGSGQSSPLSLGSSLATYTGSAKTFSTSEMEKATDNFNPSRILGEGGFGLVFSGDLDDDTRIAVKVLKRDDQQGGREFMAEVEMLSRLHHRNLVKLIGICTDDRMRCLVYELIPNGSVDSHLHGTDKEIAPLDWPSRLKIALGAARGLAYLHEDSSPRVIHRDFKSSNILLENDFTPKVSDFGLARTAMDEEHRHISTRVMGTFGYVAPEYAMTGHLLVKSDVYSYGVVLLELLTGRKPVDMSQPAGQENLVAWTRPLLTTRDGLESIIDPSLGSEVPFESVAKMAAIASMCVQPEVSHRPFMGEVVQALKLVCNECDDSKDGDSRNHSRENLSVDFDAKVNSPLSVTPPDPLQGQFSLPNYAPRHDVEKGLSVSEIFSASATLGRQASDSFRRHSASGPLRTTRGRQFWQKIRRQSRGSVSEHGIMYRLWAGSH
ncbi:uncharacterized protein LOC141605740 isoform X2 [Silene latifolia]|uniref:uncharacterized protein LOC141605740 isoform X2 n=1 Tax=Silene latifolia TaxID=37657 RepID=UPI003D76B6E8